MSEKYNPKIVEKKWQTYWQENKIFESHINKKKEKYYILEMSYSKYFKYVTYDSFYIHLEYLQMQVLDGCLFLILMGQ